MTNTVFPPMTPYQRGLASYISSKGNYSNPFPFPSVDYEDFSRGFYKAESFYHPYKSASVVFDKRPPFRTRRINSL